jgi:hypothetical protein
MARRTRWDIALNADTWFANRTFPEWGREAMADKPHIERSLIVDVVGNPVRMGLWYWAKNQAGKTVGVGIFGATISRPNDVGFYINGNGYALDIFSIFWRAYGDEPPIHAVVKRALGETD